MRPRELLIGLTLLVPTLTIGFWPRIAIDFYQAGTDALSNQLSQISVQALAQLPFIG
jgi:NAD(P)H-quinone oxidoreductase subunit 4